MPTLVHFVPVVHAFFHCSFMPECSFACYFHVGCIKVEH